MEDTESCFASVDQCHHELVTVGSIRWRILKVEAFYHPPGAFTVTVGSIRWRILKDEQMGRITTRSVSYSGLDPMEDTESVGKRLDDPLLHRQLQWARSDGGY